MSFSFKKSLLAVTASAVMCAVSARVITVNEYPGLGDYTQIAPAIAAAAKNDTISIFKHSVGYWTENLTIPKGLTLVNGDNSWIQINGTVTSTAPTDTLVIANIKIVGTLTANCSSIQLNKSTVSSTASLTASKSILMKMSTISGTGTITAPTALIDSSTFSSAANITAANKLVLSNSSVTGTAAVIAGGDAAIDDNFFYNSLSYESTTDTAVVSVTNNIITSSFFTNGTPARGSQINLIGNTMTGGFSVSDKYRLEAYANDISNSVTSSFAEGNFIGNKLAAQYFILNTGTGGAVNIIGNEFIRPNGDYSTFMTLNTSNREVRFMNNMVDAAGQSTNSTQCKALSIVSTAGAAVTAAHNSFTKVGSYMTAAAVDAPAGVTVSVYHNLFASNTTYYNSTMVSATSTQPYVSVFNNNMTSSTWYSMSNIDVNQDNIVSTVLTNAGNPAKQYINTDGTTAHIGITGGAYPFASFPAKGRLVKASRAPFVPFVYGPRRIKAGANMDIQAIGIAR